MMKRKMAGLCVVVVACCMLMGTAAVAQSRGGPYDPGLPAPDYCCEQGVPNIPVAQQCMILHPVMEGENLHMLAAYYYGDARAWRVIYQYNKKRIRNPNVIRVGQVLQVYVDPCWAPRFSLEDFKALEFRRKEILMSDSKAKMRTRVVKTELESKVVQVGLEDIEEELEKKPGARGGATPPRSRPKKPTPP